MARRVPRKGDFAFLEGLREPASLGGGLAVLGILGPALLFWMFSLQA